MYCFQYTSSQSILEEALNVNTKKEATSPVGMCGVGERYHSKQRYGIAVPGRNHESYFGLGLYRSDLISFFDRGNDSDGSWMKGLSVEGRKSLKRISVIIIIALFRRRGGPPTWSRVALAEIGSLVWGVTF